MIIDEEEHLAHYGILRRSGRYPWGSGGPENVSTNPNKRNKQFLDYIRQLLHLGMSEREIAQGMGISTTQLRAAKAIAKNQEKLAQIGMAQRLKDKGYSNVAIGERMGLNESSVRALLAPGAKDRADVLTSTSNMLRQEVDAHRFIDIGTGIENHLGVSKEKLNVAVAMLREDGYEVHPVKILQLGTGFETELKVLCPPGTTQREVWENRHSVRLPTQVSSNGGRSFSGIHPPIAISPRRVAVNFKEDGGAEADGVIYVRRGVEDISLGNARYAQVRVQVGPNHYLKGMAMYRDDLPPGIDLVFNTNKPRTASKLDAMKKLSDDPQLPFGSIVRQITRDTGTPNERVTSAMNIVNEEGDWGRWSRSIASQVLSKQSPALARAQLRETHERRQLEFEEINALTNPTVRRKLLEDFADNTDTVAVQLKAAALPRSRWHAILPIESLSPTEIYAPNYRPGERVVLIRYPHGGTFEIPELTVNNRNREARNLLGDAVDAVGIHHSVAQHLSGADFDGDTVLVIPNNQGRVRISSPLEGLRNFDPMTYRIPDDSPIPRISPRRKQQEMGRVSNLITDMTIQGASHSDIARAVRHSMVVIDAEKHNLNFRQSAIDNGIPQLMAQYQGSARGGASTLISLAGGDVRIPERKPRPQSLGGPIDRTTGERVYVPTNRTTTRRNGDVVPRQDVVRRLSVTRDAHDLSSGTPMERLYAEHSNSLRNLANQARLASVNTPRLQRNPSAARTYEAQVRSLESKLDLALRNRPLERQAQVLANMNVQARRDANPNIDSDSLRKIRYQALEEARTRVGARRNEIEITQDEWDAIQAGAVSENRLTQILARANMERVRELATPRTELLMTPTKTQLAQRLLASGATRAEVAQRLGVSLTTLDTATNA